MGSTKRAPITSATISEVLRSFTKRESALIKSHAVKYADGYLVLRSLIRDRTDAGDSEQLLAAAYAVYGWMPTILKSTQDLKSLSRLILALKQSPATASVQASRDFLGSTENTALYCLNGSVVGTSKLLHFIFPHLFPIWDSRIAALFGHRWQSHNNPSAYREYFDAMHEYCEQSNLSSIPVFKLLQCSAPNDPLTPMRLVEYALFLESLIRNGSDLTDPD